MVLIHRPKIPPPQTTKNTKTKKDKKETTRGKIQKQNNKFLSNIHARPRFLSLDRPRNDWIRHK